MSELLRKSSHAYGLVDSWGYGPNLAEGPIKGQNKPVNGLKLPNLGPNLGLGRIYGQKNPINGLKCPLLSPFEAAISQ